MKKIIFTLILATSLFALDLGTLLGAGAGIAIGNQFKHHKNTAKIIGGITGAYIGSSLQEHNYKNTRVIEERNYYIEPRTCYNIYYRTKKVYYYDQFRIRRWRYVRTEVQVERECR